VKELGGSPHRSLQLLGRNERDLGVAHVVGGVAALGPLLWAFKKPVRLDRKNGSRVCSRW